jgi:hypothetical protein
VYQENVKTRLYCIAISLSTMILVLRLSIRLSQPDQINLMPVPKRVVLILVFVHGPLTLYTLLSIPVVSAATPARPFCRGSFGIFAV